MEKLTALMVKLTGKHVVIIGGGNVALRKARGLSVTGATVTVVSPDILPELLELPNIIWCEKQFSPEDIQSAHLIYAATNDKKINQLIGHYVQDWQWFNDTSQPENANFYTPAMIYTADLTVAISTEGNDPAKAKQIKQQLLDYLDADDHINK